MILLFSINVLQNRLLTPFPHSSTVQPPFLLLLNQQAVLNSNVHLSATNSSIYKSRSQRIAAHLHNRNRYRQFPDHRCHRRNFWPALWAACCYSDKSAF
ncbi:hypothetical protein AVEN_122560-1 [Araneus ventricosus]|uniref:Uncharacterized protein n=1 Tax=Araneus ventricosus TaxID=182803 RepID=A0A4Y2IQ26_ARAVE|nr:hypothetical protein AVEN_122560-1 [Araneus ventricosus]